MLGIAIVPAVDLQLLCGVFGLLVSCFCMACSSMPMAAETNHRATAFRVESHAAGTKAVIRMHCEGKHRLSSMGLIMYIC